MEARSLARQLRNEGRMGREVQRSRKGSGLVREGEGLTGLGMEGRTGRGWIQDLPEEGEEGSREV